MEESTDILRLAGFHLLSEERKSEILGMAEALTYAQKGEFTGSVILAVSDGIKKQQKALGSLV